MGDVMIKILGSDGVTPIFRKIGSEAASAGSAIDSAAKKAASGLGGIEEAGRRADAAFEKVTERTTEFTRELGSFARNGLQELAAAGEQNAQAQRQLEAAIANTGHTWGEYATAIEKATSSAAQFGISDDAATNALQALTETTGSAANALNLLQVSEDLAAAKHMDLVTAAQLVGKAYAGNTQQLSRYGIVLQQGATGQEAIAALTQKFSGQAEAHANMLSRVTAEMENWKGAMGESLSAITPYVTLLPGLSEGFSVAASGGKLLISMFEAQGAKAAEAALALEAETVAATEAAAAGEGAALAEAGLAGGLLGPAGLVVGLGAAAAAFLLLRHHTDDYQSAAAAAAAASDRLGQAIATMAAAGGDPTTISDLKAVQNEWTDLVSTATAYAAAKKLLSTMPGPMAIAISQPEGPDASDAEKQYRMAQALVMQLEATGKAYQDLSKAQQDAVSTDLSELFNHQGINADKAKAAVDQLFASYESGAISSDELVSGIDGLSASFFQFQDTVATTDAATTALLASLDKITSAAHDKWAAAVDPLKDVPDLLAHIDTSFDASAARVQHGADLVAASYKKALEAAAGDPAKVRAATDEYVRSIYALNDILTQSEAQTALADQTMASFNATMDYAGIAADQTGSSLDHLRAQFPRLQEAADGLHHSLAAVVSDLAAQGSAGGRTVIDALANAAQQHAAVLATAQAAGAISPYTAPGMNLTQADIDAYNKQMAANQQKALGLIQQAGQTPSFVDVLAKTMPTPKMPQLPMDFLNTLINVQGQYGKIDDALAAGTMTQDQWNLAQKTYNALTIEGAGDTKALVTQLINVKGEHGAIDDLLKQGAISQEQWNELQKIGTEVLKARSQVDFTVIAGMQHATTTLDDMTRVVIGNTDTIGKNSDSLKKWADDLIGPVGTWSEIDVLQQKGKLSLQEYNAAQWAQVSISETNARVQEDVATIQAKQAPLLADLADQQEKYLNQISELPAKQQLAALGFMDSAESAKAMSLNALAASAAMGELGSKGEGAATKIITGAAEADPALKEMLLSMGLISQGADGTITVNFPTGETVQTAINGLQSSIETLTAVEYRLSIGADTSDFWDHVHGLDGTHVGSVWVDVLAAYSAPLLPYQDPNYGLYPAGANGITAMALGGTARDPSTIYDPILPRFAGGGTMTLVGEHGPELVNLVRGDQVTNAVATRSRLGSRGSAVNVHYHGNVIVQPSSGNLQDELYNSAVQRERRRG